MKNKKHIFNSMNLLILSLFLSLAEVVSTLIGIKQTAYGDVSNTLSSLSPVTLLTILIFGGLSIMLGVIVFYKQIKKLVIASFILSIGLIIILLLGIKQTAYSTGIVDSVISLGTGILLVLGVLVVITTLLGLVIFVRKHK